MECKFCGDMEEVQVEVISLFGREFSIPMCLWHRMTYSNLSVTDRMEYTKGLIYNEMEVSIAPTVQYTIEWSTEPYGNGTVHKYYSNGDHETLDMDDSMQEMMEYYMEYDGMDVMDAIDKVMEDYMEDN